MKGNIKESKEIEIKLLPPKKEHKVVVTISPEKFIDPESILKSKGYQKNEQTNVIEFASSSQTYDYVNTRKRKLISPNPISPNEELDIEEPCHSSTCLIHAVLPAYEKKCKRVEELQTKDPLVHSRK